MGKFDRKFHISIEERQRKKNLGHNTPVSSDRSARHRFHMTEILGEVSKT